ncbi:MAG: toll/interleukin-1 receptor domain-containing protein [Flavobacteriales bacterium]|nr:toll/interleukin-1 receptor domain-containing protein [Flavobacteriales bacterium]
MPEETQRQTIFIAHATHEDDYYAGWLAAKLRALGYRVFVDLDDLAGGDTFTTRIQPVIENESAVFLPITTRTYAEKAADDRSGVRKELNVASSVNVKNFIVPLKFDDLPYHKWPMDYRGQNGFDFHNRLGDGLIDLVTDLQEKRRIAYAEDTQTPLSIWHKAIGQRTVVTEAPEQVITNWYPIALPEVLYVHRPYSMPTGNALDLVTYRRHGDHIVTFAPLREGINGVPLLSSLSFKTEDVLHAQALNHEDFGTIVKPGNYLKTLLNKTLGYHFKLRGLEFIEQSNKRRIYYVPFAGDDAVRVPLTKYGQHSIQLNGIKEGYRWYFAVSHSASLHPVPHYRLSFHIVFKTKEGDAVDDATEHALRRGFAGELYNRKVLNLFLGLLDTLRTGPDADSIELHIDGFSFYDMSLEPLSIATQIGYVEPV